MSRASALRDAAHWAIRDEAEPAPPPALAAEVQATLDDPALDDALGQAAMFGRLSDGDVRAMRRRRTTRLASGAAAAVALSLGIGMVGQTSGWFTPAAMVAHYETQRGQPQTVKLADGSTVRLDGATRLDVTIAGDKRVAMLGSGEAYFDVAHDPARPFTVLAGGSSTRVLGTAFDVTIARGAVRLEVYRGTVRFGNAGGSGRDVILPAGWRSRFERGIALLPVRVDPAQQGGQGGWVDTDDMRLGELVDMLNRRGGPVIADPPMGLADTKLSGRFKLDNPRELLSALGIAYDFRVVAERDRLRIVAAGRR